MWRGHPAASGMVSAGAAPRPWEAAAPCGAGAGGSRETCPPSPPPAHTLSTAPREAEAGGRERNAPFARPRKRVGAAGRSRGAGQRGDAPGGARGEACGRQMRCGSKFAFSPLPKAQIAAGFPTLQGVSRCSVPLPCPLGLPAGVKALRRAAGRSPRPRRGIPSPGLGWAGGWAGSGRPQGSPAAPSRQPGEVL